MAGPGLEITVASTTACGASPTGKECQMSNNEIFRECGDGWEGLLAPIIAEADRVGVELSQVKEKYGTLRVYFNFTPATSEVDILEELIDQAEHESQRTCEMCGKPGHLMVKGGWYKTVCADDALSLGYKTRA